MQKCISQIVHVLLLFLVSVEEAKLNNCSTINHDNAHVGTWHLWLVHRHFFSLTPSRRDIDDYLESLCTCVLKIHYEFKLG